MSFISHLRLASKDRHLELEPENEALVKRRRRLKLRREASSGFLNNLKKRMDMREKEDSMRNLQDMIDIKKLMGYTMDLTIPKKVLVTTSTIRSALLLPLMIPLAEFTIVFVIGGLVLLFPASISEIKENWSQTFGFVLFFLYFSVWSVDTVMFIIRKTEFFYYTLLTLGLRVVIGILVNVYCSATIDIVFAWIWMFLAVTVVLGIMKAINHESMSFVYQLINLFFIVIGCLLISLAFSDANNYYIGMAACLSFLYQVSLFHEVSLVKYLFQLPLEEWESEFIHLSPRIAYYVKWVYEDRKMNLKRIELDEF